MSFQSKTLSLPCHISDCHCHSSAHTLVSSAHVVSTVITILCMWFQVSSVHAGEQALHHSVRVPKSAVHVQARLSQPFCAHILGSAGHMQGMAVAVLRADALLTCMHTEWWSAVSPCMYTADLARANETVTIIPCFMI